MLRRQLLGLSALLMSGCATEYPPDYFRPAPPLPLQDPPPGMAVVYLIRTPHDGQTIQVLLDGQSPFLLPPETHTVLFLQPGRYALKGVHRSTFGAKSEAFLPVQLQVSADSRSFFYLSGVSGRSMQMQGLVPLAGGILMPIVTEQLAVDAATRTWKPCSEHDAQGFLSVARYVRAD